MRSRPPTRWRGSADVRGDARAGASGAALIYPWKLRDGRELPIAGPELESVHRTRAELIEARVREALRAAGPDATALDLACNEGWFSHRLLEWGASRVVAIDVRESNVRRATVLRDHFENPTGAVRLARACTRDLCVIESQLTRQTEPIVHGNGRP